MNQVKFILAAIASFIVAFILQWAEVGPFLSYVAGVLVTATTMLFGDARVVVVEFTTDDDDK